MNTINKPSHNAPYITGDVVSGRRWVEGKPVGGVRKGIVLGAFVSDPKHVVVWWYGMGEPSLKTTGLMFQHELSPAGDIFDFSADQARSLAKKSARFARSATVSGMLFRHAQRMRQAGACFTSE